MLSPQGFSRLRSLLFWEVFPRRSTADTGFLGVHPFTFGCQGSWQDSQQRLWNRAVCDILFTR